MAISHEVKVPGVICRLCGQCIPVLDDPRKLPLEFEAECPICSGTETYRREEIQALADADKPAF